MLQRSLGYYLTKANRLTGWLLFFLVLVFIPSGFAITGQYGFQRLLEPNRAATVHALLVWPVIGSFLVHSMLNIYFAFRRWGWWPWTKHRTT
jgi:hypothetical protein